MDIKELALKLAFEELGKPYVWGGQGPDGWDCSGLIIEVLQKCRIFPPGKDDTAQGVYNRFRMFEQNEPERGCAVFWGELRSNITHCALIVSPELIIGANGRKERAVTVELFNYRETKYNLGDRAFIVDPFKAGFVKN